MDPKGAFDAAAHFLRVERVIPSSDLRMGEDREEKQAEGRRQQRDETGVPAWFLHGERESACGLPQRPESEDWNSAYATAAIFIFLTTAAGAGIVASGLWYVPFEGKFEFRQGAIVGTRLAGGVEADLDA